MKLIIRSGNLNGRTELATYINNRVTFAFSQCRHAVESASVALQDVNGPKGGIDKQCRVLVKPVGMERFGITERQSDVYQAIYNCLSRASQSLDRKLKRRRARVKKVFRVPHIDAEPT